MVKRLNTGRDMTGGRVGEGGKRSKGSEGGKRGRVVVEEGGRSQRKSGRGHGGRSEEWPESSERKGGGCWCALIGVVYL
jgi:hypothetical protein